MPGKQHVRCFEAYFFAVQKIDESEASSNLISAFVRSTSKEASKEASKEVSMVSSP
jgi:hypothetical protein